MWKFKLKGQQVENTDDLGQDTDLQASCKPMSFAYDEQNLREREREK